jgi:hypothetical protein
MDTMFHLCAYRGSVGAGVSNFDLPAVQDGQLSIINSHFIVPKPAQVLWAFGCGVNMSAALLNTPKMRYVGFPSLTPINVVATVPSPPNVSLQQMNNVWVDPVDEIAVQVSQTDAGSQTMTVIMALAFQTKTPLAQPSFRISATAAVTCTAGQWTNGNITLSQTIPRGDYIVTGMDVVGTNLLAARLLFAGQGYRPGVLARNAVQNVPHPYFQGQDMGSFGQFNSINIPSVDFLAGGTCTSQTVYLDLQRVQGPSSAGF